MNRQALVIGFLVLNLANAQEPRHAIQEDHPQVGSSIRRNLTGPAAIPINLSYERLSREHKKKFHENYVAIADGDEAPFPKTGLQDLLKPITQGQQRLRVEGDLYLIASVTAEGTVKEVHALGSPSPEMTSFASQVLLLTPFKPAICGGKPCAMQFPLRIRFDLR